MPSVAFELFIYLWTSPVPVPRSSSPRSSSSRLSRRLRFRPDTKKTAGPEMALPLVFLELFTYVWTSPSTTDRCRERKVLFPWTPSIQLHRQITIPASWWIQAIITILRARAIGARIKPLGAKYILKVILQLKSLKKNMWQSFIIRVPRVFIGWGSL